MIAGAALASPPLAGSATSSWQGVPAPAERIAATTATYSAIQAKIAAGQSLRLRFPDPTAQEDIIDYGVNDLWKTGIDGACVSVAYVVTNPDPGLAASMAAYDAAMHLPPANITEMALPAPSNPSAVCQLECSTGEDRLDAEAIHSMAPYANIVFVHPPVPETIGMQGWPGVAQAIKMIADQHLGDVITVSLGDGENDFINDPTNPTASQQAVIHSLDPAFLDAAAHNIPVMFASGDCGPTAPPVLGDTGQCTPGLVVNRGSPLAAAMSAIIRSYHFYSGHSSASDGNDRCRDFTFAYTVRARSSAASGRPIRTLRSHQPLGMLLKAPRPEHVPPQRHTRPVGAEGQTATYPSPQRVDRHDISLQDMAH